MSKKKAKTVKKARKTAAPVKRAGTEDPYDKLRNRIKSRRSGTVYWSPPEGDSLLRVIPFETENGELEVFVKDFRHWNIEPGNRSSSVTCPGPDMCPICDVMDDLPSKLASRVKVSKKFLCNAVVRSKEGDKPVIATLAQMVVFPIEGYGARGSYSHWDTKKKKSVQVAVDVIDDMFRMDARGRDVLIRRKDVGGFTQYDVIPCKQTSAVGITVTPVDLTTRVKAADDEHLEKIAKLLSER